MNQVETQEVRNRVNKLIDEWQTRSNHVTWDNFLREKALWNVVEAEYLQLKSDVLKSQNG